MKPKKESQHARTKTIPWFIALWLVFWMSVLINALNYAGLAYIKGWPVAMTLLHHRYALEVTLLQSRDAMAAEAFKWLSRFISREFTDISVPLSTSLSKKIESRENTKPPMLQKIQLIKRHVYQGLIFLKLLFSLCLIKFINIFASIWLYAMTIVLGILDGLTARYIRTVEGGRESTFIFHHLSQTWARVLFFIVLLDSCSPVWTISPNVMALMIAALLFFYSRTRCAHLKKFL